MEPIQRGDMVGLFYEYGPKSCIYLGLAEFIGLEDPPKGLALAGKFDGKHLKLSSRGMAIIDGKQMAFRLLDTEEIVYEQEAWYAPQVMINRLLEGCETQNETTISYLREIREILLDLRKNSTIYADGFIEVHIPFVDFILPDEAKDENFDVNQHITDKILNVLGAIGFDPDEITVKTRELDDHYKENS